MYGSLIGAGISAIGSIFGASKAAKERRKAKRRMEQQLRENEAWYQRRYNEDITQRADAVHALELARENIQQRNRDAAAMQAVVGGTDESLAASRAANNKVLSDATASIAAQGAAEKNAIEQRYQANKAAIQGQQNAYDLQSAQNVANATQGIFNAAGSIASAWDAYDAGKAEDARYNKLVAALAGINS